MESHAYPKLGIPVAFLSSSALRVQNFIGAAAQDYLPGEFEIGDMDVMALSQLLL